MVAGLTALLFLLAPAPRVHAQSGLPFGVEDPAIQQDLEYLYRMNTKNAKSIVNLPASSGGSSGGTTLQVSLNGTQVSSPTATVNFQTPLTASQSPTGTANVSVQSSGISPASYGTASSVPTCTFNTYGMATSCSNTSIQVGESQVTGLTVDLAPIGQLGVSSAANAAAIQSTYTYLLSQINNSGVTAGTQTITWVYENQTSNVTGSNTGFTLKYVPSSSQSIFLLLNGAAQTSGVDYTYTFPKTITMSTAPAANTASLVFQYTINTSTFPNVFITNSSNNPTGYNIFDSTDIFRSSDTFLGPVTMNTVTIASATATNFYGGGANITGVSSANVTGNWGDSRIAISTGVSLTGKWGDDKTYISTNGVSGTWGDSRIAISTGVSLTGKWYDDKTAISTAGVTAGKFGDGQVGISTKAIANWNNNTIGIYASSVTASSATFTQTGTYSLVLSSGVNVVSGGLFYNGTQGTTASPSASQTLCGGTVSGGIWTGATACAASSGQSFTAWQIDAFTGAAGTWAFTLSQTAISAASEQVYLNGINMISGTDYTSTTSVVTFSTAPKTGALISVRYMR